MLKFVYFVSRIILHKIVLYKAVIIYRTIINLLYNFENLLRTNHCKYIHKIKIIRLRNSQSFKCASLFSGGAVRWLWRQVKVNMAAFTGEYKAAYDFWYHVSLSTMIVWRKFCIEFKLDPPSRPTPDNPCQLLGRQCNTAAHLGRNWLPVPVEYLQSDAW